MTGEYGLIIARNLKSAPRPKHRSYTSTSTFGKRSTRDRLYSNHYYSLNERLYSAGPTSSPISRNLFFAEVRPSPEFLGLCIALQLLATPLYLPTPKTPLYIRFQTPPHIPLMSLLITLLPRIPRHLLLGMLLRLLRDSRVVHCAVDGLC